MSESVVPDGRYLLLLGDGARPSNRADLFRDCDTLLSDDERWRCDAGEGDGRVRGGGDKGSFATRGGRVGQVRGMWKCFVREAEQGNQRLV